MEEKDDELFDIFSTVTSGIHYKQLFLLFILFIVISSTTFIERILINFSGTVDKSGNVTNTGMLLQDMFLVMSFMIAGALTNIGII